MKMFTVYCIILLYGLSQLFSNYKEQPFEANLIMAVNLIAVFCLISARYILYKTKQSSLQVIEAEIEDQHRLNLERNVYTSLTCIQLSLSLSFVMMLVGFLLLRNEQPAIVLWSISLCIIAFLNFFPSKWIMNITNQSFELPDPQKNPHHTLFDLLDDGEKYVMLKGLLQSHSVVIWGLVILEFILVFYSAFSGNSQLVSIIGIGFILMFIQLKYILSLKPAK